MSRIGKQPIPVPAGVTVTIEGNKITGFDDFRAGRTVRHGRTPA